MIYATLTSKVSGRVVTATYTPEQLLTQIMDAFDLMEHATACACQPMGETNVVECSCDEEWVDFDITLTVVADNAETQPTPLSSIESVLESAATDAEKVERIETILEIDKKNAQPNLSDVD